MFTPDISKTIDDDIQEELDPQSPHEPVTPLEDEGFGEEDIVVDMLTCFKRSAMMSIVSKVAAVMSMT